jgi:FkbM family methyltransferase
MVQMIRPPKPSRRRFVQDHVTPPAPAGSLLVIGAGRASGLADWRAGMVSSEAPVVLVEPDPAAMADLEARLAGVPGITLLPFALGAEAGEVELRLFNVPGLASLHTPTGLKDLLPGLRELRRVPVPAVPVAEALASFGDLPDPLHVRIDAPGSEGVILAGMIKAGLLARAARVELRCGTEALFDGAPDLATIRALMLGEGMVSVAIDLADPDWPQVTFAPGGFPSPRLMQTQLAETEAFAASLAATLTTRETELKALEEKADWRHKRIGELEAELKKQVDLATTAKAAALEQISAAQAEAGQKVAALATDLDSTRSALSARERALEQAQTQATALKATLTTRETELKALEEKADWRHKRIGELEAELKKQVDLATTAKAAALEQISAAQAEAGQKVAALATDLDSTRSALSARERALEQAQTQATALKATLTTRETELKALEEKADWRHKRIGELEAELKKQVDLATTAKAAALEQISAAQAEAGQKVAALATDLDSTRSALSARERALEQAQTQATALKATLTTRETELKALEEKADWRHKRIGELEAELKKQVDLATKSSRRQAELDHRLILSRNELRRAEGQIDLIKDLLLRGEVL